MDNGLRRLYNLVEIYKICVVLWLRCKALFFNNAQANVFKGEIMSKKIPFVILLVVLLVTSCAGAFAFGATEEIEEYPGTNKDKYEGLPNEYDSTEWFYANVGSNARGTYSTDGGIINIKPEEGRGKMADSDEGFCFYYTKVDATKENFYLKATFTVTKWKGDNQNGFGLSAPTWWANKTTENI